MKSYICLGIESTAHTFGIGIVSSKGEILANEKSTYIPPEGYGIKPTEAANHHKTKGEKILKKSLDVSGLTLKDIDIIAFSQGPGLPPCLHVGFEFAKNIAKNKMLLGVNHCVAHIEIGKLTTSTKDPVVLYVSGANTQVLSFVEGKYRCFGETQDIGMGNALDKLGRAMGMEFPAGPKIEKFAKKGRYIELPYTVKGMDVSFSGIVTESIRKYKNGCKIEDICFSFQEVCFAMLTEITERAMAHTEKSEMLLTGGVGANKRLQEMLNTMCKERGAEFFKVPFEFAGDNGAMIAWTGILMHNAGQRSEMKIVPNQRTDDVHIKWLI